MKSVIESTGIASLRRVFTLFLSATLVLALGGLFALPAGAQEADAPDRIESFDVGSSPYGLAFDGANIWVTSVATDYVTELRASDGALLGTFFAGAQTINATFDGTYIWVAQLYDNTVSRLLASDGTLQGTFDVGSIRKVA